MKKIRIIVLSDGFSIYERTTISALRGFMIKALRARFSNDYEIVGQNPKSSGRNVRAFVLNNNRRIKRQSQNAEFLTNEKLLKALVCFGGRPAAEPLVAVRKCEQNVKFGFKSGAFAFYTVYRKILQYRQELKIQCFNVLN